MKIEFSEKIKAELWQKYDSNPLIDYMPDYLMACIDYVNGNDWEFVWFKLEFPESEHDWPSFTCQVNMGGFEYQDLESSIEDLWPKNLR